MNAAHPKYGWKDARPTCAHEYIMPTVARHIKELAKDKPIKILDIGCGNGYVASKLAELGHSMIAVDISTDGIEIARSAYPSVKFRVCSVYDPALKEVVGELVDCVIALEVVEHLFYPKKLFEQSYQILKDGGYLIVSTPYHGYWKNLALSLVNGWDRHFKVDWDGGHIKLFSRRTLAQMARAVGFKNPRVRGVGRLPWLWKSMIMDVEK